MSLWTFICCKGPYRRPEHSNHPEDIEEGRPVTVIRAIENHTAVHQDSRYVEANHLTKVNPGKYEWNQQSLLLWGNPHRKKVIHSRERCALKETNQHADDAGGGNRVPTCDRHEQAQNGWDQDTRQEQNLRSTVLYTPRGRNLTQCIAPVKGRLQIIFIN